MGNDFIQLYLVGALYINTKCHQAINRYSAGYKDHTWYLQMPKVRYTRCWVLGTCNDDLGSDNGLVIALFLLHISVTHPQEINVEYQIQGVT